MLRKLFLFLMAVIGTVTMNAQALAPISWTAYGLTFDAPKGILVEEDTEDTYLLNNSRFYITLQALDSDDITRPILLELYHPNRVLEA